MTGGFAHLTELLARAEDVLMREGGDAEVEARFFGLMKLLRPDGGDGNYPAAGMLAQALKLTVGCRMNGAHDEAKSWAQIAGALVPMVARYRGEEAARLGEVNRGSTT